MVLARTPPQRSHARMKSSLDHLPARKQTQLQGIVQIIRELAEVEMLILFGSHARGDWVEDPENGYFSDFDLLVLVQTEGMADSDKLWSRVRDRAQNLTRDVPVSIVVHTVKDVNQKLERGQYFFTDIHQEGIVLYDSYRHQLAEPRKMTAEQRRAFAQECFESYFERGNQFYANFEFNLQNAWYQVAAFQLHQAAENYYKTVTLVFTAYRPKDHNIENLGNKCGKLHEAMRGIFPRGPTATPEDEARFKLLKAAYVDARYSMKYRISREDLEILAGHVRTLRARTERACREHIALLAAAAASQAQH
jgi:predicted nucleotidyltransferase/HEPN domain-containing protein